MAVYMKPTSEIILDLGLEKGGKVDTFITNTVYKKMDKYVPMDKGNLRKIVDVNPGLIIYESNYALYQYKGVREDGTHKVRYYTTPGTGSYWDKRMLSAEGKDLTREVQEYIGGK